MELGLTLRAITSEDRQVWDALIDDSPQGSVFLLDGCLSLWVASEPRLHMLRFGCFDGAGRLVAGQVFLHRKKTLGIRVQTCLNFPYNCSPILARSLHPESPEYAVILQALARQAERLFPSFCFECHPSLQDVRPLLELGWRAMPEYAHTWDLREPDKLLQWLSNKGRFRQANDALGRFSYADETSLETVALFPPLYRKSAQRYKLTLEDDWEATFQARIEWLLDHNAARCFTCRRLDGTLLGILIYVLNRAHGTAFGWMVAYTLEPGERDFLRGLYLFSLGHLAGETRQVDIAEGIRPALYDFKDSLGTDSTPYFLVENPRAELCRKVFKVYRRTRGLLAGARP
jgi:hypothetical protein